MVESAAAVNIAGIQKPGASPAVMKVNAMTLEEKSRYVDVRTRVLCRATMTKCRKMNAVKRRRFVPSLQTGKEEV
jgi:hypothetical protein